MPNIHFLASLHVPAPGSGDKNKHGYSQHLHVDTEAYFTVVNNSYGS